MPIITTKNVKVVLNNPSVIEQLETILQPFGVAIDNVDLDHKVADEDFSNTILIIIDPELGESGLVTGIIDTLKSRSATSSIPILLCSNKDNDNAIIAGLNSGANDFILLPASTRSLQKRISRLVKLGN